MKKKKQKLINTKVITWHNTIAISRDKQSWRSSFNLIQTFTIFFISLCLMRLKLGLIDLWSQDIVIALCFVMTLVLFNFFHFSALSNPPWLFFTFFKLLKWYQITQIITNTLTIAAKRFISPILLLVMLSKTYVNGQ